MPYQVASHFSHLNKYISKFLSMYMFVLNSVCIRYHYAHNSVLWGDKIIQEWLGGGLTSQLIWTLRMTCYQNVGINAKITRFGKYSSRSYKIIVYGCFKPRTMIVWHFCSLLCAYRRVFIDKHTISFKFWSRSGDFLILGKNLTILQINNVGTYMDDTLCILEIVWCTKLLASCF